MAEALVSFLINELASVIKQELELEVRLVLGVEEDVEKLKSTFVSLLTVLDDADRKKLMGKRKVTNWLEKLKTAAYEMEDVLDEWRTAIQRSQLETSRNEQVISWVFTASKRVVVGNDDIASRIKKIQKTLDNLLTERENFTFKNEIYFFMIENEMRVQGSYDNLQTSVKHDIFRRDHDEQIILDKLLGPVETPVISITGKTGVGKTTLAQLVFNHEKVRAHFQTHIWICVSDPFDVEMVKKSIIREATDNKPFDPQTWLALNTKPTDAHLLNKELVQSISEKKFLIVLDDVWTDEPEDWVHLKLLINDGAQGSRILVTTQLDSVASMAGPWEHNLSVLSDQDSALLLRHFAFRGVSEECEILEDDCFEDISLKCHGLPLAISLVGSYMNNNVSEEHWRQILESKIWELHEFHAQGLLNPAFLLSYDGLSAPLKNCFAYCALFQNDHKILKQTLIRLWMAQGFLNSRNNETKKPELVGQEYFDELVNRCFFQHFSGVNDGGKVYYKMHDLTQQFVKYLTYDTHYTCFFDQSYTTSQDYDNTLGSNHHISLVYLEPDVCPSSFNDTIKLYDNIRSVRCTSTDGAQSFGSLSSDIVHHLRCVRVMELENMGITRLPEEIDQLIHLRYLNLSHNENLSELPNSFCNLLNLQTLNLSFCPSLGKLPKEIGRLINLINLDIEATSLEYLPKGIQGWKSLQTLSSFIVSSASEGCSIEELSHLNLLQGCIRIYGLRILKSADEAGRAQLHMKDQLSQVWLDFNTSEEISSGAELQQNSEGLVVESLMESVLEVLQPHPNLETLNISNYLGFSFPRWISNVKALRSLVLTSCTNWTELPVLGHLPFLETILISHLQNLEHIGVEIYGDNRCVTTDVAFPKLTSFSIERNPNLKVWEFVNRDVQVREIMPYLTSITMMENTNISSLRALGTLPSLESLIVWGVLKLTSISPEFYGIGCDAFSRIGGRASSLRLFPKLLHLEIGGMPELEVMDMGEVLLEEGIGKDEISIMPCLKLVRIGCCPKLKLLRFLSTSLSSLVNLSLHDLPILEDFKFFEEEEKEVDSASLLPCLFDLELHKCDNLKSFPRHLPSLSRLSIESCSSIHDLRLYIPISPNLTRLALHIQPHFSLENIAQFKELESLCFTGLIYESLHLIPETLRTLTKLRSLIFENEDMCKEVGDWSILSHIPQIFIAGEFIDPLTYSSKWECFT